MYLYVLWVYLVWFFLDVFGVSPHVPEFYRREAIPIRDYYMKIEFDAEKTIEEKYPYMVEW